MERAFRRKSNAEIREMISKINKLFEVRRKQEDLLYELYAVIATEVLISHVEDHPQERLLHNRDWAHGEYYKAESSIKKASKIIADAIGAAPPRAVVVRSLNAAHHYMAKHHSE